MTTANVKGGFSKSIQITRNHDSESNTTLKQEFLKDTEKYVLQVQNFYTSAASKINTHTGVLFAIRKFGPGGGPTPAYANYYRQSDYEFSGTFHSVSDFVYRLQQFFHRFGFLFYKLSVPNLVGPNPAVLPAGQKATAPLNFYKNFQTPDGTQLHGTSNIGWSQSQAVRKAAGQSENLCTAGINANNKLEFILSPSFLANFYIEVSAGMQEMLGLAPQIFSFYDNAVTYSDATGQALFQAGTQNFVNDIDNRIITANEIVRITRFSVDELDSRLSLDIQCTFPNSNKISVFNGKEEHEYILARFIMNDYKTFKTNTISDDNGIRGTRSITESMVIGLENLTRGNPNVESNFLLPGSFRQFQIGLFSRYFEGGKIITKKTDVEDGFWSLKLLFSKKV